MSMDNKNILKEQMLTSEESVTEAEDKNSAPFDAQLDAERETESVCPDASDGTSCEENGAETHLIPSDNTDAELAESEKADTEEPEAESEPKAEEKKKTRLPKWLRALFASLLCLILASAAAICIFVLITCRTITVEIGETPHPEKRYSSELLASLYTVDEYAVDISKPCRISVGLKFFGFLPARTHIEVRDTKPPEIELIPVYSVVGAELTAEDFVKSVSDSTYVTLTLNSIRQTAGVQTVTITATDECGNKTSAKASLTLSDEIYALTAEVGHINAEEHLRKMYHDIVKINTEGISNLKVGDHMIRAEAEEGRYVWLLRVKDTVPPSLQTHSISARTGDVLSPDMAISAIDEISDYSVSFLRIPKTECESKTNVVICVEDNSGNITERTVQLLVADIPTERSFEYGVIAEEIIESVLENTEFKDGFTFENLSTELGETELRAVYDDFVYTVNVSVSDTVPPMLELADATVYRGMQASPEIFVKSCTDLSNVTYKFGDSPPETDEIGELHVTVIAVDEGGNETSGEACLTILDDTTAPVIYGVYEKTTVIGENVSFKKGVYAIDKENGEVAVKVDASAVNTAAIGRYPVTYSAVDLAGNVTEITSYYNVVEVSYSLIDYLADEVLAQIITPDMTQYQRAEAIYIWCTRNIRYSTRTSYLMGKYVEAAYSGLTTRSGNCYIYYAVSSLLLSRAGIENIMIERNIPSSPHVWSLVKMDGGWYHFDACPHYDGHELRCFLLTDSQVKAYSENEVIGYYSFDSSLYPATP